MNVQERIMDYACDLAYDAINWSYEDGEVEHRLLGAIDICNRLGLLSGLDAFDLLDDALDQYEQCVNNEEWAKKDENDE